MSKDDGPRGELAVVDRQVVVPPIEEPTKRRFVFAAFPTDTSPAYTHKVTSQYCEEEWLQYIGPIALLLARRMDNHLSSNNSSGAVEVKQWARSMCISMEEFVSALNRLDRYGLGEWKSGNEFLLRRHWPAVPLAIATPKHRDALLAISD